MAKFVTLDNDAESEECPRFLRQSEESFTSSKAEYHIKRQRENYQNKVVFGLFKKVDILVLEKLKIEKAGIPGRQTMFVDPWVQHSSTTTA